MKHNILFIFLTVLIVSCTNSSPDDLTEPLPELVNFDADVAPIIQSQCLNCHNSNFASGNLVLENYNDVRNSTENGSLIDRITRSVGDPLIMPQNGQLPQTSINIIIQWQNDGYLEN